MMDKENVGYKSPPKHSQWQKGQSGNPNGRPKKGNTTPNIDEFHKTLIDMMGEEVVVNINGGTVSLPYEQIIIKKLMSKAAQGDNKSIKMLTDLYQKALYKNSNHSKENGGIQLVFLDKDDAKL